MATNKPTPTPWPMSPTGGTSLWLPPGRDPGQSEGTRGAREGDPNWREVVKKNHPSWRENDLRWRFLMDSLLGGNRYRNAVYGIDRRGMPVRNLIRHNREYPDVQTNPGDWSGLGGMFPGSGLAGAENATGMAALMAPFGPMPGFLGADPAATAHDDDYEYRRSRTPIPPFVKEACSTHLGKLYDQEIKRDGPDDLKAWWADVDGRGTPIDDWMREKVAPLALTLGCLDICLDHPKAPPGEKVETRADELRLKLNRCVASWVLPQNLVWWKLDAASRYTSCLVREYTDPSERDDLDENGAVIDPDGAGKASQQWRRSFVRWRYWTDTESVLLSHDGDAILERVPHGFGRVPIVRLIHTPDFHGDNLGQSEYEAIAGFQREYYNRDSEMILSDTLQVHPFLSGPEDFCKADNTLSVGPGYILPMKKNAEGGGYQGWEFVSPPKDPADSLRANLAAIRSAVDRDACLAPPAGAIAGGQHGATGGGGGARGPVAQSGISKEMDAHTGHKKLRGLAKGLARMERELAEFALMVLRNTPIEALRDQFDAIKVVYPARFELRGSDQMSTDALNFQRILSLAGDAPMAEAGVLKSMLRQLLPDLEDAEYEVYDAEIDAAMAVKSRLKEQMRELSVAGISDATDIEGSGSTEQGASDDPIGQSGMTAVAGVQQLVI